MTDDTTDLTETDIREHYDRIDPVVEALAELDGAVTLGNDDRRGWYVKRDCRNQQAVADGFDRQARPATLAADWDTIKGRIDRVLYAITSYKPKRALMDWEPCTWNTETEDTDWQTEKPMPKYRDMEGVAMWGDIDLVDDLKPQRGDLDAETQAVVEQTLATYAEAYAILYGSRDAIFALDSVGGSYIMGPPDATRPIAEHFSNDADARQRVFEELVKNRANDWLEGAQVFVEATVDGAEDVIDPDWCNNRNRAYKAPLSIHGDHDAVVTPFDPFDPTYEMTPVDAVDDDLIEECVEWAEDLTETSYENLTENLIENLWPEYTREHGDWRTALEEWVEDERLEEAGPDRDEQNDESEVSTSTDHRITPSIDDVYAGIDGLDVERVAEDTIVAKWTENVSGASDNSGSGKKAFLPTWGPSLGGGSGNANYINMEKGAWVDTANTEHGTVVEMALISEENWSRGEIAKGEDWARGLAYLREMGYDIPIWTPDASVSDHDEMPYWALKQAAFALGVCTEDDLIDDEEAGYKRFDAETYNTTLDAVDDAGLEHGREKVDRNSRSSSGTSNGSTLFDLSTKEALASSHPDVEVGDEIDLLPEEEHIGAVQVREGHDGLELYDASISGGYSYIPLSWFAVLSGERSAAHPSGRFSNRELWGAWREAKEQGALPIDDPVPLRARLHVAREHDLAPGRFIEAAEDDPSALPPAVYNNILEKIEDEYGLNPGLDDMEVDRKAEQRAEFLAGGGEDGAEADKDREIKRMLATLDEVSE